MNSLGEELYGNQRERERNDGRGRARINPETDVWVLIRRNEAGAYAMALFI